MITCSRLAFPASCGETIRHATAVPMDKTLRVKVTAAGDRSWLIPVTANTSWPAFLAMFGEKAAGMEAQGAAAKFEYNGQVIDGKLWHDLMETSKTTIVKLLMRGVEYNVDDADLQIANEEALTPEIGAESGSAQQAPESKDNSSLMIGQTSTSSRPVKAAIFQTPAGSRNLRLFQHRHSTSDMRSLADSLHNVLLSNDRVREREAYSSCPAAKISDIQAWLAPDSVRTGREESLKAVRASRKPKRRIVLVAKHLFSVFWPLNFEHPMTGKFWGALHQILRREDEVYSQIRTSLKYEYTSVQCCCKTSDLPERESWLTSRLW